MNNCPNCNSPYQTGDEVCRTCGFILPITTPIINPGEVLQTRYEIQELVHSGGMGYVYLATDKRLYDRICIVKQVKEPIKSDDHRKKLEEEALRMSRLDHPNVAMILDHFIDGGYYFLVVERIHGKTLSEVFKEHRGHLTEKEVVNWAISICDVVSYLHNEGIVHRDISPDNIMLTGEGSIKFIDFGTLREFRYIAPGGTVGIGKYGYTPPEQWQGKPEFRSDIFALGATIYYMLTGFLPLSRGYTTRQAPQKEDFNPAFPPIRTRNPAVSPQLEAVLQKALQLNINDRYSSAAEFGEALRNLEQVEVKAKKTPALKVETKPKSIGKPKPKISLRWAAISLGIILFLIAGAGGIYFISGHPLTQPSTSSPETATPPPETATPPTETTTPPPDTTPPLISQVNVAGYTGETATITWETDEDAAGQVEYGETDAYGKLAATDGALTTSHSVELTGLQPNTAYHFRVKSTDKSGNEIVSGDSTFTTWIAEKDWKEYVNDEYGFSLQYPENWVARPDMVTQPENVVYFSVADFVPGVAIRALEADAPVTEEWIVASFNKLGFGGVKVKSDLQEVTLPDGSKAIGYKVNYIATTGYDVEAYALEADKDGKRIRILVYTVAQFAEYDEALFSQIAHTLRFTSPPSTQPTSAPPPESPQPAPTPTTSPPPAPPSPAELSFKAKTYTNDEYGFSIQYPNNWPSNPNIITVPDIQLAAFQVENYVPGVVCMVYDKPEAVTKEWIVESFKLTGNTMPKVTSDIKEETLSDGSKAYTYKAEYTSVTNYKITVYCIDAIKGDNLIRIDVYTIDSFEPYNEALASEIAHTLRFTQ